MKDLPWTANVQPEMLCLVSYEIFLQYSASIL